MPRKDLKMDIVVNNMHMCQMDFNFLFLKGSTRVEDGGFWNDNCWFVET